MELYPIDLYPLPPLETPEVPVEQVPAKPEAEAEPEEGKGTVIDVYV
jgi:hypothetical protein